MAKLKNWLTNHSVITFIVISYGITWLLWIPSLIFAAKSGYTLPTTDNFIAFWGQGVENSRHLLMAVCFSAAVYGPTIAGLIVTRLERGQEGVKALLKRIVHWKVELKWYVIVLILAIAIPVVPFVIAVLSGVMRKHGIVVTPVFQTALILFLSQILTSGIGEEIGWRGYLLPKLLKEFKGEKGIWTAGLIWAVWHFPFVIYFNLSNISNLSFGNTMMVLVLALAGNTLSLIGMTYVYTWMLKKTDSLLLPILFHATVNVVMALTVGKVLLYEPMLSPLVGFMPWIFAILLGKLTAKDDEQYSL